MGTPKMNPERWARVKEVLDSALGLRPKERDGYLAVACAEDPSLRSEVESLLRAQEQSPDSFMKTGEARSSLPRGTKLGSYEISELIGVGGMGEVYRARDFQLRRDVAIKVLPPIFALDAERLRRFEQEARATAALDHPNVLAIHHLGSHEGQPYIVSELLQGHTLREELSRGALPARKAINFGLQIARGLAAAHEKGIVHRDLKPENIFITKDGQTKILDFGLAKLRPLGLDHETRTSPDTEAGMIVGTLAYMSPEQVRGQEVDHRADIFALGAILYEMVSGRSAFRKETAADTQSAILKEEPPDFAVLQVKASPTLERVVRRCLEKVPEHRFQSTPDLGFALDAISTSSELSSSHFARPHGGLNRRWVFAFLILVLLVAATLWITIPSGTPQVTAVTQLTNDGLAKSTFSTLASDGSRVYFNETRTGEWNIAEVSVQGGETAALPSKISNPFIAGISPDKTNLLVLAGPGTVPMWTLPLPVGEPRRLSRLLAQDGTYFPDGRVISIQYSDLYNAEPDGSNPQKVLTGSNMLSWPDISPDGRSLRLTMQSGAFSESIWETASDGTTLHDVLKNWRHPAIHCCGKWTPDGRYFVFQSLQNGRWDLWALPTQRPLWRSSRSPIRLTNGPLSYEAPLPSRDGKKIFAIGSAPRGELVHYDSASSQFVPYASGISAVEAGVSQAGTWMVYLSYPDRTLWRCHPDGSDRLQLTYAPMMVFYPRLSPDGRRVAFSGLSGKRDDIGLYVVSVEGGTPERLADGGAMSWSPDGSALAYTAPIPGRGRGSAGFLQLYKIDIATKEIAVIPNSVGKTWTAWLPLNILVAVNEDWNRLTLFDFTTNQWSDLASGSFAALAQSPDGKYVYYETTGSRVMRIRMGDHKIESVLQLKEIRRLVDDMTGTLGGGTWLGVTPDGSVLLTRDVGTQEIYALDVQWP